MTWEFDEWMLLANTQIWNKMRNDLFVHLSSLIGYRMLCALNCLICVLDTGNIIVFNANGIVAAWLTPTIRCHGCILQRSFLTPIFLLYDYFLSWFSIFFVYFISPAWYIFYVWWLSSHYESVIITRLLFFSDIVLDLLTDCPCIENKD